MDDLAASVRDARARTLALVADLDDAQLVGPRLAVVNPLLWEIGHVAWFHERWALRHHLGRAPLVAEADRLWDSGAVAHDTRWHLPLPSRAETLAAMAAIQDSVLQALGRDGSPELEYLVRYAVLHEDMHGEAFAYTRQTLGYPAPSLGGGTAVPPSMIDRADGDAQVAGGTFLLGAARDAPFVFDNEKWAHPVEVRPFRMARTATTAGAFAAFVDDRGYARRDLWTAAGWAWRTAAGAEGPVYWRRADGGWEQRVFDQWRPLDPRLPVLHVNAHEAEAFCRWSGRRLPTEAEWEAAASLSMGAKRTFPWGDAPPDPSRANLDGGSAGPVDAAALAAGDSVNGVRQLIGNVWEWTATDFGPYPGFVPDMYADYSQPWFGTHRVLRGGGAFTRARLIRSTYRNFYPPDRRDVWAGFRTCAVDR